MKLNSNDVMLPLERRGHCAYHSAVNLNSEPAILISMTDGATAAEQGIFPNAFGSERVRGPSKPRYSAVKRAGDLLGSIVLAAMFLPLMLIIAFCIRQDGGPIFFRQERIGQHGRKFQIIKFRTMVEDADAALASALMSNPLAKAEWEQFHKLKSDPRITRIGRFLRKTSLDEFPQLINVLKGEMSLVGPRPIVSKEIQKYGRSYRFYQSSKPGLTGLWQVSGRNDISYRSRVALDRTYASKASIFLDARICLQTPRHMFMRRSGY